MKIYKFKDLTEEDKHPHFFQILLHKSIWCASPDSLNDKDEFKFKLDYEPSQDTVDLLAQAIRKHRTTNQLSPNLSATMVLKRKLLARIAEPIISDVVQCCRESIGITSFSLIKDDEELWKRYGGEGNGVCIEINIPDPLVDQTYHKVQYVHERIFHVDTFLKSSLFPDKVFETYRSILLTKTKKWKKEEELRFIGKSQNVSFIFDGNVTEVTFGSSVPQDILKKFEDTIGDHCRKNKISILKL